MVDLSFWIFSRSKRDHLPCIPFSCNLSMALAKRCIAADISGMVRTDPGNIPDGVLVLVLDFVVKPPAAKKLFPIPNTAGFKWGRDFLSLATSSI